MALPWAGGGKEEKGGGGGGGGGGGHAGVAGEAALEAFGRHPLELRLEGEEKRNGGSGWRGVLRDVALEEEKIEVPAAMGNRSGAFEGPVADGGESQPRGEGKALLRRGDYHV